MQENIKQNKKIFKKHVNKNRQTNPEKKDPGKKSKTANIMNNP